MNTDYLKFLVLAITRLPRLLSPIPKGNKTVQLAPPLTYFFPHPSKSIHLLPRVNEKGLQSAYLAFRVLSQTLQESPNYFSNAPATQFIWAERTLKRMERPNFSNLILEHGWLPRSSFQISPDGSNFHHHLINKTIDAQSLIGKAKLDRILRLISESKTLIEPPVKGPYFVVAMQIGNDFNLKYSQSEFSQFFGSGNKSTEQFGNALIAVLQKNVNSYPLLFCQHPADHSGGRYTTSEKNRFISKDSGYKTIDLAKHPNCAGVIAVNSNILHEAAAAQKPCFAFGRLLHPDKQSPFSQNLTEFLRAPQKSEKANNYLAKLIAYQWTLNDLLDPRMTAALIQDPRNVIPWKLRYEFGLH